MHLTRRLVAVNPNIAPLTAIVLTLNEEQLLPRCLSNLDWVDEIVVVDSGSTDYTISIAEGFGARVIKQPWLGWPRQRNIGIDAARNDWVMFVESDEIPTARLKESIQRQLFNSDPRDAFSVDRRNEFLGVVLPNSQRRKRIRGFVRIFNRTHSRYDTEVLVHENVIVKGKIHLLEGQLLHWRRQSTEELVSRLNNYATIEAQQLQLQSHRHSILKIVIQPIARVLWLLLIKGELRFGMHGIAHAYIRAMADIIRQIRLWEHTLAPTPLHPPEYQPQSIIDTPRATD